MTWWKQNAVALAVAVASLFGSAVVGGRLLGQLDAGLAAIARVERDMANLTNEVSALRERTSALDERTRRDR